jgi:AcrR family transcriptional regulator
VNARPANGAADRDVVDDRRAQRRATRIANNREEILDAAERVFAERGIGEGSLRDIARASGFSTAAIYNYFENKSDLLAATLVRRGTGLLDAINAAAVSEATSMGRLHRIVDATVAYFEAFPDFRLMLRSARADQTIAAVITNYATDQLPLANQTLKLMTEIIRQGQRNMEVRDGSADALVHLYMVLVYEHVFLAASRDDHTQVLTLAQFHELIDGALRKPRSSS